MSYDGSNFQGFQYQTPKVRTVQGELEKAAGRVLLPASRVVGASRTDAGAHATGQVAHLDVTGSPDSIQPDSLMMYMNGVLPDDVKVQHVEVAPPGGSQQWTAATTVMQSSVIHQHKQHIDLDPCTTDMVAVALYLIKTCILPCAAAGFDSHYSSVGKVYTYKLASGVPDPLKVEVGVMNVLSKHLSP